MRRIASVALLTLLCAATLAASASAQVNWKQFQGTEVRFLMNKHPFTTFIEPKIAEFEKLTGIKVMMEVFPNFNCPAMAAGAQPLKKSIARVARPNRGPATRATLVAPMLPLPQRRMSALVNRRVSNRPQGMEPSR